MTKITNKEVVRLYDGLQQMEASGADYSIEILDNITECQGILEEDFDLLDEQKNKLLNLFVKQDNNGLLIKDVTGFVYNNPDAKQEFLSKLGDLMSREKEYNLPKIKRKDLPKTMKSVRNISKYLLFCVEK